MAGGYDDYWWLHRWRLLIHSWSTASMQRIPGHASARASHAAYVQWAGEGVFMCCDAQRSPGIGQWEMMDMMGNDGKWWEMMGNDGKWEMSWMWSSNGFSPKLERFLGCISRVRWFRLGTAVLCRLSWDQTTFGSIVSGMWCSIGHYVIRAKFVSRCGAAFVSRRWVRSGWIVSRCTGCVRANTIQHKVRLVEVT